MGRGLSDLQKTILEMAYRNRLLEWEPRPIANRVLVLDSPEEKDLRALAPEAFEMFPDGYWEAKSRCYLIAGSFRNGGQAEQFAKELERRGLWTHDNWTVCRERTEELCDVFSSQVYHDVYGFGYVRNTAAPPGFPNARLARKFFNIQAGEGHNYEHPRYATARVSVARAFNRLATRGLARRGWAGIWLTDGGVEAARKLVMAEGKRSLHVIHDGVVKEITVNKDYNITIANHYEREAAERITEAGRGNG